MMLRIEIKLRWRGAEVKVQIEEYRTIDLTIRLSSSDGSSQSQYRQFKKPDTNPDW